MFSLIPEPKVRTFSWPLHIPAPKRLYAIADVHGCHAELLVILTYLFSEERINIEHDWVFFLGDYCDRGPDSRKVITRLIAFRKKFRNAVFLAGNHDDFFLGFLGYPSTGGISLFFANGGYDCLSSYGVDSDRARDMPEVWRRKLFPKTHIAFMRALRHIAYVGPYILNHSGLDWGKPLEEQTVRDMLWSRVQHGAHDFGKVVVHGHSPRHDVRFNLPDEMAIDTGCAFPDWGHKLSCVELNSGRVLQVQNGSKTVETSQGSSLSQQRIRLAFAR